MAEVLLAGVIEDFRDLIVKHSLKKSYNFDDFVKTWNDLKFYYIYSGRTKLDEMVFFTEHILIIAKRLFFFYTTDIEKTAALYLLHVLYFSQPLLKLVSIRIERHELKAIVEFIEQMKPISPDVPFAFLRLLFKNAFHFVYFTQYRTAEKSGKVNLQNLKMIPEFADTLKSNTLTLMEELSNVGFSIDDWRKEEDKYTEVIRKISQKDNIPKLNNYEPYDFVKDLEETPQNVTGAPIKRTKVQGTRRPIRIHKMTEGWTPSVKLEEPQPGCSKSLPLIKLDEDPDFDCKTEND